MTSEEPEDEDCTSVTFIGLVTFSEETTAALGCFDLGDLLDFDFSGDIEETASGFTIFSDDVDVVKGLTFLTFFSDEVVLDSPRARSVDGFPFARPFSEVSG